MVDAELEVPVCLCVLVMISLFKILRNESNHCWSADFGFSMAKLKTLEFSQSHVSTVFTMLPRKPGR